MSEPVPARPVAQVSVEDTFVIHYSTDDDRWIAHSLRTDQIGTGPQVLQALVDGIIAVKQVCQEAAEDETVAHLREAPQDVLARQQSAQELPPPLTELARLMAHGQWPEMSGAVEIKPHGETHDFLAHVLVQS